MRLLEAWREARPLTRLLTLGLLAAGPGALLLWATRSEPQRPAPAVSRASIAASAPAAPTVAPLATPTAGPTPAVLPDPTSLAQASAVARAFLVAYASYRPDDTAASLRSRLRPYVTDAFDAELGEGGAGGQPDPTAARQPATASVQRISAVGLAPDGRLVMVATVDLAAASGSGARTKYVELYLAPTSGGWRVAEVSL